MSDGAQLLIADRHRVQVSFAFHARSVRTLKTGKPGAILIDPQLMLGRKSRDVRTSTVEKWFQ